MIYVAWLLLGAILAAVYILIGNKIKVPDFKTNMAIGLFVAALIYVGFALAWGNAQWVAIEALGLPIYGGMAWLGLRKSPIWLGVGWLLHMPWDMFVHYIGPGFHLAPVWYMFACFSFDLIVGVYLIIRFFRQHTPKTSEVSKTSDVS